MKFWSKLDILVKNQNFSQISKFRFLTAISILRENLVIRHFCRQIMDKLWKLCTYPSFPFQLNSVVGLCCRLHVTRDRPSTCPALSGHINRQICLLHSIAPPPRNIIFDVLDFTQLLCHANLQSTTVDSSGAAISPSLDGAANLPGFGHV